MSWMAAAIRLVALKRSVQSSVGRPIAAKRLLLLQSRIACDDSNTSLRCPWSVQEMCDLDASKWLLAKRLLKFTYGFLRVGQ